MEERVGGDNRLTGVEDAERREGRKGGSCGRRRCRNAEEREERERGKERWNKKRVEADEVICCSMTRRDLETDECVLNM